MTSETDPRTKDFDTNNVGLAGTLFGLPETSPSKSQVVIVPVRWDATTSYNPGTSNAPDAIVEASSQIDFYLRDIEDPTSIKYALSHDLDHIKELNDQTRPKAETIIDTLSEGGKLDDSRLLDDINAASEQVNQQVKEVCGKLLDKKKTVVLLGGDHSTPLGFIKALAERNPDFGILHVDAHADLRVAYEGFKDSHASIMYNVTQQVPQVKKIVQVGIRDISQAEVDYAKDTDGRVVMFHDEKISGLMAEGKTWEFIVDKIISELPKNVYISFDIDGLKQENCPNTGTPVPGGLEYNQALYLISKVVESGRRIIGADLNEVGYNPKTEWDAVVGMRLLFRLCAATACSQGKLKKRDGVLL